MKQIPKLLLLPNEAQRPSNDICAMKIGLKLTNSKQITAILVCTDSKAALTTSKSMLVTIELSNTITITTKNSKLGLAKASGPIPLSQQAQQYNWPIAQQFYEWKTYVESCSSWFLEPYPYSTISIKSQFSGRFIIYAQSVTDSKFPPLVHYIQIRTHTEK